jgi:hypothetical protein
MSWIGPFQAGIAEARGNDYAFILSATIAVVALALIVVTFVGREAPAAHFGPAPASH